jgi:catechol 2,3-dioxygenase-like lactoylglutathione lyase family enzyme
MPNPRDIALDMGRAERQGDRNSLDRYLHKDLIFRRANGSVVNKEEFLAELKPREGRLDSEIMEDEEEGLLARADSVVVTLIVRTLDASFRNVRVFVRDDGEWQCKLWVNTRLETPPELQVEFLHHVSLPVRNLRESQVFYENVLGLRESRIPRPDFPFPGTWYQVGANQLHLIVRKEGADPEDRERPAPTYRTPKSVDSRDIHFAVRVYGFAKALAHFNKMGYSEDAEGSFKIRVNRPSTHSGAGFPQIYILDPDDHVIEINAQTEDG